MKMNFNTLVNMLILASLVASVTACNSRIPANRPLVASVTDPNATEPEPDELPSRPDGAIAFNAYFCGCKDTKNILVPDTYCNNFCAGKSTSGQERLYYTFTPNDEIVVSGLQNTNGWCTQDFNADDANANCVLSGKAAADSDTFLEFEGALNTASGGTTGNSFYTVIDGMPADKTFVINLQNTTTKGVFKSSNSIQVRKVSDGAGQEELGPVAIQPVSEYACIVRLFESSNTNSTTTAAFYNEAKPLHFYFIESLRPDPIPAGINQYLCHNRLTYGNEDRTEFPRLFEKPNAFALWSSNDVRFLDLKGTTAGSASNGSLDIEDSILNRLTALGVTPSSTRFFGKLSISSGPTLSSAGNTTNAGVNLGYYMRLFINDSTKLATCPKIADYNGNTAIFKVLGEILQEETEGVYLARREASTYIDASGNAVCLPDDITIVRETDLRKVWFYYKNGQPIRPTNDTNGELAIKNNKMLFFYPMNPASPTVRNASQKTYTVITPAQAAVNACQTTNSGIPQTPDSSSIPTSVAPHDKRFGCIPVSNNN